MPESKFPPGGPRQPVYDYLTKLGFAMSEHSDKHWTRPDGLSVLIYGAGSMAQVTKTFCDWADGIVEMPLDRLAGFILKNLE